MLLKRDRVMAVVFPEPDSPMIMYQGKTYSGLPNRLSCDCFSNSVTSFHLRPKTALKLSALIPILVAALCVANSLDLV